MKKDAISYSNMMYYSMDERHFTFAEIRLELDSNVDDEAMEKAFARTVRRFPYFFVTLKEEESCLFEVPNPKTPEIHHDDLDYVIDYKNNDGFLFRFSTKDNMLTVSWFHGLTDGVGVFNFYRVLLTEYYRNLGEKVIPAKGLFDIDGEPTEEETTIPLSRVPDVKKTTSVTKGGFYRIRGKKLKNMESYTFSVDQESFMKFAKANGGSPNSISQIEIARAIEDTYPDAKNSPVGVSIAINAKPILGIPNSYMPHLSVYVYKFNSQDFDSDYKELNKKVRQNLSDFVKEENIIPALASTKVVFKIMNHMKHVRTKRLFCYNATTGAVATVAESYVGIEDFGSIEKHIKSLYSIVEASLPLVEINFVNGRFFFSITAKIDIDEFVRKLHGRFVELGCDCSAVEKRTLKTHTGRTGFPKLGLNLTTLRMIKAVNAYKKEAAEEK